MSKKLLLIAFVAFGFSAILIQSASAARAVLTNPYRPPVKTPTSG